MKTMLAIEKELRYWFSLEDWYPSTYTRRFLAGAPPDEVREMLTMIAQDAECETPSLWWVFVRGLLVSGFATSQGVLGQEANRRREGVRAALYLAGLGDPHAIAPLARVWQSVGWKKSKYHDDVEGALLSLFQRTRAMGYRHGFSPDVNDFVLRVWNADRLRDLSNRHTDLILAAMHYLSGETNDEDSTALRTLAAAKVRGTNRTLVRDAAVALNSGKTTPVVARMIHL